MGVFTLLRYLVGDERAIRTLAASSWALPVGFLFVLSAALAREYDGQDLLHEPRHLLLPFGASIITSLVLFTFAFGQPRRYLAFLALFWLTAPLAWLYAVPYERFLTAADAVRANLWTLGLVSAWRVALMVRILVALLGYTTWAALWMVLAVADGVALVGALSLPFSLMDTMAGIRPTEADAVQGSVAVTVMAFGGILFIPLFVGAFANRLDTRPTWQVPVDAPARRPSGHLWALAFGSVAVWALILPYTQPEQQLRRRVEENLQGGHVRTALAEMSEHDPEDFPPHWTPSPQHRWLARRTGQSLLLDIWEEMLAKPPAPWVREIYLSRLRELLQPGYFVSDDDVPRLGQLLARLPEGAKMVTAQDPEEWSPRDTLLQSLKPYLREPTVVPSTAPRR
jgi:hypothetical protein